MKDELLQNFYSGNQVRVALLGIPLDSHSSFLRGSALAPQRVRSVLHSKSSNWSTELGLDLSSGQAGSCGDLEVSQQTRLRINVRPFLPYWRWKPSTRWVATIHHLPILRAYALPRF
jgi:arginase family enzyme